jgi:hypothetical protein
LASLEIKEHAKRANSQQSIDRFLRDSAHLFPTFYKVSSCRAIVNS